MNTNETEKNIKKRKPIVLVMVIVLSAIVLCLLILLISSFFIKGASQKHYNKQLDMAEKYIMDADYDKAILAYKEAIKINPNDEEAYLRLSDTYDTMIQSAITEGNTETAINYYEDIITILESGVRNTDSNEIKDRLIKKKNAKQELEDKRNQPEENQPKEQSEDQSRVERHEYEDGSGYFELEYDSLGRMVRNSSFYNDGSTSEVLYTPRENSSSEQWDYERAERYKNNQLTGYTIVEYAGEKKSKFYAYDENGSLIKSMDYIVDNNGNYIRYPITFLDLHYGGWIDVEEQYEDGSPKKIVEYDENDNYRRTSYYDENGEMIQNEDSQ